MLNWGKIRSLIELWQLQATPVTRRFRTLGFLVVYAMSSGLTASAQPGTVLFAEDFDNGPLTCDTLAPAWTSSDANLGDIDNSTSNSNACSLFTRGGAVTVTSLVIDTSGIIGADLSVWVRQGEDTFSEDPDNGGENLQIEYLNTGGSWISLQTLDAVAIAPGAVTLVNVSLPFDGLHSGLQIRVRQLGGSGGPPANNGIGFDYWHVDDVLLVETGTPPPPPATPTLTANSCDDFEGGLVNWTASDTARSGINGDTFGSASNALFLRHGNVTTTSVAVSAPALEEVTVFVQRGSDAFSENPEGGEDLIIEFLDDTGAFIILETFTGAGAQGEIFNRAYAMPAAARHGGFRLRFRYGAASGADFDYWHVDDVCLISGLPDLTVSKTVEIEDAPGAAAGETFAVPGAFARYRIEVVNNGTGVVDAGSLDLSDGIDANTVLFVGDLDGAGSPFVFTDGTGAGASGVSLVFGGLGDGADGIVFRDTGGAEIVPVPDFDPQATRFDLTFDGVMQGATGGTPTTFSVEYRVRLN